MITYYLFSSAFSITITPGVCLLSETAKEALLNGSVKMRVIRSGMYQQMTFVIKKVRLGNVEYKELFIDRLIDMSEINRIANEIGLPVEAQNGRAFPKGTSSQNFQDI